MNPRESAINWDFLSRAERVQGKLQRYFDLLKQVRSLEEDPELAAALAALGNHSAQEGRAEQAPTAGQKAGLPPMPQRSHSRGAGDRLIALARPGEQFDARVLLERVTDQDDLQLANMTPKQGNDHLRRAAEAGRLRLVVPGKRGKTGSMPVYQLVTDSTSAAEEGK